MGTLVRPNALLGWGAHPSNRGPCSYCDQPIAWGLTVHHQTVLLEPKPYPMGTIMVRNNGTHLGDLEDQIFFDPRLIDVARSAGIPLYRRHRHAGLYTRGRPLRIGEKLSEPELEELAQITAFRSTLK